VLSAAQNAAMSNPAGAPALPTITTSGDATSADAQAGVTAPALQLVDEDAEMVNAAAEADANPA